MKLHDLDLSGNAYKVRLFLSLIGREATLRPVDFLNREHKTQAFLRMNPRGQIPVLEDGELQLGDSTPFSSIWHDAMPVPSGIRSTPSARAASPTGSAIRPTRCRTARPAPG